MTPRSGTGNPAHTSGTQAARSFIRVESVTGSRGAGKKIRVVERVIGSALWELIKLRCVGKNPALKWDPNHSDRYFGRIITVFLQGCRVALHHGFGSKLVCELNSYEDDVRGFAFEGAAMGLSLLDFFVRWQKPRFENIRQLGECHTYIAHVGLGWTVAFCRIPIERAIQAADPLLRWLIVDGCGFYYGFFHGHKCLEKQWTPRRFSLGYASRAFDQGLGRSLWFAHQADIHKMHEAINSFVAYRRSDLWSGIGLACSYAGGVSPSALERLSWVAREFRLELAQGAAFAAQARRRAHTPAQHTEIACEVLCNMSSEEAALITEACLENLPTDGLEPAYEVWRHRIRDSFL